MADRKSLRYLRRLADLTQQALADRAGVHKNTISKYETGELTPSLLIARRIADVLRVPVDQIEFSASHQGVA